MSSPEPSIADWESPIACRAPCKLIAAVLIRVYRYGQLMFVKGAMEKAVPVQLLIEHHLVAQHKAVRQQIQQRSGFERFVSFLR